MWDTFNVRHRSQTRLNLIITSEQRARNRLDQVNSTIQSLQPFTSSTVALQYFKVKDSLAGANVSSLSSQSCALKPDIFFKSSVLKSFSVRLGSCSSVLGASLSPQKFTRMP